MHIRIDDTVEITTGDDRGLRGKVLRVDHQAGKIVVEGVNRVYKHVRRSQKNPQGGRLSKEMPIILLIPSGKPSNKFLTWSISLEKDGKNEKNIIMVPTKDAVHMMVDFL